MTQDEIIQMACNSFGGLIKKEERENFLSFAKLVAEAEKERIANKIEKLPFGDTAQSFAIWVRNDT